MEEILKLSLELNLDNIEEKIPILMEKINIYSNELEDISSMQIGMMIHDSLNNNYFKNQTNIDGIKKAILIWKNYTGNAEFISKIDNLLTKHDIDWVIGSKPLSEETEKWLNKLLEDIITKN